VEGLKAPEDRGEHNAARRAIEQLLQMLAFPAWTVLPQQRRSVPIMK
jgi:hypothetical protein